MTSDEKFKSQLLYGCRQLFRDESLFSDEVVASLFVPRVAKAAIGYCDKLFFTVMARRLHVHQEAPPLSAATKSLFQAVSHDAPKPEIAEAAVTLVLSAWQHYGSGFVEAVGQSLIHQVRYEARVCRACSSQIASASRSPFCEQCEAKNETVGEKMERAAINGWKEMTPEKQAEMEAYFREIEEERDEYEHGRDEELEK